MRTLLLFLFINSYALFAQEITITGTITDESNIPMPGVNVIVKGTSNGTQTDFDGNYEINAELGSILVYSYLAYVTEEHNVTATSTEISFSMKPSSAVLEEVVVTGYSSKKERKSMGYSVSSTSSESIKTRDLTSLYGSKTSDWEREYKSGQLTAGEINDLEKWDEWIKSSNNFEAKKAQKNWGFTFKNRTTVFVKDKFGKPIQNVKVSIYQNKEKLNTSVTDMDGKTILFKNVLDFSPRDIFRIQIYFENQIFGKEIGRNTKTVNFTIENNSKNNRNVDVMFTIDATGSMGDEMDYLKAELQNIISRLDKSIQEKRVALTFYRDEGDDFVVKDFDFNSNINEVKAILAANQADGGGDYEEAVEKALKVSMEQSWNANYKLLFLLLDAPPHFTQENVKTIKEQINIAKNKGIKIIPIVASDANKEVEFLMRFFSISTNGTYVFLTDDSGIGNDHLEPTTDSFKVEKLNDLIIRLIEKYSGVES